MPATAPPTAAPPLATLLGRPTGTVAIVSPPGDDRPLAVDPVRWSAYPDLNWDEQTR